MTRFWLASAAAFALTTSSALAQSQPFDATNSTQPNMSTNGPAGTYAVTKTRRTIDSNGASTDATTSFAKSQTYTSGGGALSARTSIKTSGATTTTLPQPTSTVTTTTTQEIRP